MGYRCVRFKAAGGLVVSLSKKVPTTILSSKSGRPAQCPLWVKSRHRGMSEVRPLYPRKQTWLLDGHVSFVPEADIGGNNAGASPHVVAA